MQNLSCRVREREMAIAVKSKLSASVEVCLCFWSFNLNISFLIGKLCTQWVLNPWTYLLHFLLGGGIVIWVKGSMSFKSRIPGRTKDLALNELKCIVYMLSASNSVFAAIVASLLQYTCLIVLDVIEISSLNQLCKICIQTNIVYNQQGVKSLIQINYYQSNINIGKMTGLSSHSVSVLYLVSVFTSAQFFYQWFWLV